MAIKKNIVRIIAGELRGRQVECEVNPRLRPTPQRAREALFSILGGDLTGVHFVDVFAGTGVIGMEALSRRAERCWFIEKDPKLAQALEKHLRLFRIADRVAVLRDGKPQVFEYDLALNGLEHGFEMRMARAGATGHLSAEAAPGEAALIQRLSPDARAARQWADLAQNLGVRARRGKSVNLDPFALLMDMVLKIEETALALA